MKKEIFIIDIHSFVDVITNSSTELFMLETDKSLELVREIVKEKEKEFPPDYGHYVTVDYCDDYFLNEAFGWFNDEDIENTIKYLEGKGYTIIPPQKKIRNQNILQYHPKEVVSTQNYLILLRRILMLFITHAKLKKLKIWQQDILNQ
jgi:hypothetical protein